MKINLFVRAKKIKNKQGRQGYVSRICGGGTPKGGELKLGRFFEIMDLINRVNFYMY
jgi:hypothetical protein